MRKIALAPLLFLLSACGSSDATPPPEDGRPVIAIAVGTEYTPSEVTAEANAPVRLVFTRTTDQGCGQQLVFPEQDIRRDLPLNEPVAVDLTMPAEGRVRFTCGMDMYEGAVVVR